MKKNSLNVFILILFPYFYLFPHTFNFIEMGNDFELLYFSYKKYIFEFLSIGHIPLWSPSESMGYSLIFNPFAQYFYPLSWMLFGLSYLIGDLSKHLYLLYTIFGISIYNVGQYFWLKKLNIDIKYCLISTLIICVSLKLTEILRFPNAIHAFCWFPWILYGMTLCLRKGINTKALLIIFVSTISVLTAGYPYYIIYALIFFSCYFLFISIPYIKNLITHNYQQEHIFLLFIKISSTPLLALIIVLPWFLGIQDVMEITRDRNLDDISFSRSINSDSIDHLGSLIFPPISQAETNYYFGSIVTLSILFYFINLFFTKERPKFEFAFLVFFILFFILNFQISNSQNSLLFEFLWNKIDLIKNMRAFGRINILLLPLTSVLICFSLRNIFEKKYKINFNKIIIFLGLIILILQIFIIEFSNYENWYWETWQAKRLNQAASDFPLIGFIFLLYNNYIYSIFLVISIIVLIMIKKYNFLKIQNYIILAIVVGELFVLANIQWAIPYKYYDANGYNELSLNPLKDIRSSFKSSRLSTEVKGNTFFRNNRKFNINYFDNFGISQHTKMFDTYFDRNGNFRDDVENEIKKKIEFLWGLNNNYKKIFLSKSIHHKNIDSFVEDIYSIQDNFNGNLIVDIKEFNGDKILIEYTARETFYITYVDNWSPGWVVTVNSKNKKLEKALKTYKSVKIEKGKNIIKFFYKPW